METKGLPDESRYFASVRGKVEERNRRRMVRHRAGIGRVHPDDFYTLMKDLRQNHAAAVASTQKNGIPWIPLNERELIFLERQVGIYEGEKKLEVLEDISVHSEEATRALATLRINQVTGRTVILGPDFRECTRLLVADAITHFNYPFPLERDRVIVIPIWRAGLIMAEGYREMGFHRFGHLGCRRNETRPNEQEIYYAAIPSIRSDDQVHIIDPMLATGGSIETALLAMVAQGVTPENHRIIVHALVAAPEGVDYLLSRHPKLHIIAHTRDGHLNERAYIEDVGLGDAGDQLMDGVDETYALAHWVGRGIMSMEEAGIVVDRTQKRVAEITQATPPSPPPA